jgi:cytosine/adenosine deaminase-related metal-dependent hydrolase
MRKICADLIIPVSSAPLRNGVVAIDEDGTILSIEEGNDLNDVSIEKFSGIICPGFINAHCHLELSYMKGKIPEHTGIVQFLINLIEYRNQRNQNAISGILAEEINTAIRNAVAEMKTQGIVGVGDISNDYYTFDTKSAGNLLFHTFIESFGFNPLHAESYFQKALQLFQQARASGLAASITPHAPYSVTPELFAQIFSYDAYHPKLFSYHNQESNAEADLFKSAQGDFIKLFHQFNLPGKTFLPTGKNSLHSVIGYFPPESRMLFVHNTTTDAADIELIISRLREAYFCFCPNANLYIENTLPAFSLFKRYPDRICVGTDSYASNHQLSILQELITIQQHNHSLETTELIRWATLNGASFYNWSGQLGSLETGKKPGINLIGPVGPAFELLKDSSVTRLA